MHPETEHLGDDTLQLGRILRGGVDSDLSLLPGRGNRRLALEVELLLAAARELAFDSVLRLAPRACEVSSLDATRRPEERALSNRLLDAQDGWLLIDEDAHGVATTARCIHAGSGDDDDRLPDVVDAIFREKRLVREDRAEAVVSGNVRGGEHRDDAFGAARLVDVDVEDPAVRARTAGERNLDLVGLRNDVVDEQRLAGHVAACGVVR